MLYMPTNISPSSIGALGNGTVDATQDLMVSWQINGQSPLVAFEIAIFANDYASTQKYTTGRLTDNCPFYGTDFNGNVQFFFHAIPATTLASSGITNGNEYKLVITQWWSATDFVTQASASLFITRSEPIVTITNLPNPLTTRSHSFIASFSQAQGDTPMNIRWQLASASEPETLLIDTLVSGTAQLRMDYDGFFPDNSYIVQCEVETTRGITASTGWQEFSVMYASENLIGEFSACIACGHSANFLRWRNIFYIPGHPAGPYSLVNGQLRLPSGSFVTWDTVTGQQMVFNAPWSVVWQGCVDAGDTVSVLELDGDTATLAIELHPAGIRVKIDNTSVYSLPFARWSADLVTVIATESGVAVRIIRPMGGLWPRTGLRPYTGLYPVQSTIGIYQTDKQVAPIPSFVINSVRLNGKQACDFVYVVRGVMPESKIDMILANEIYEPTLTRDAYLLCTFDNDLEAGNLGGGDGTLTSFRIYRQTGDAPTAQPLIDVPIEAGDSLLDFSAASKAEYRYRSYAVGEGTLSESPYVSNKVTPCFKAWTILECTPDDGGVYHVVAEHAFKLNLVSGQVTNNNTPEVLKTFTPYPLIQGESSNFQSGMLASLIGVAQGGDYYDSLAKKQEIMALSTTQNTLFLKNPDGEVLKVKVSAPISMTVADNTRQQAKTMGLPWSEIGDASGVSIVSVPTDPFWPYK